MELEEKLKKAFKELENHGEIKIEFAYLFGSCAEDTHTFRSDIDVAVYFTLNPSVDDELSLHAFLTRQLKTDKIDLV